MICKMINTQQRYYPIPISFLVKTANAFICDIFIESGSHQINVKDYNDLHNNLRGCSSMLFYFNGMDEQAAQNKIERILTS